MKITSSAQLALFNENRERRSARTREKTSAARSCSGSKAASNRKFLTLNLEAVVAEWAVGGTLKIKSPHHRYGDSISYAKHESAFDFSIDGIIGV